MRENKHRAQRAMIRSDARMPERPALNDSEYNIPSRGFQNSTHNRRTHGIHGQRQNRNRERSGGVAGLGVRRSGRRDRTGAASPDSPALLGAGRDGVPSN